MRLLVCPRTRLESYRDAPVTHFVSLVDPDELDAIQLRPRSTRHQLQLVFSDLDDIEVTLPRFAKYTAPHEDHMARIVEFGRHLDTIEDWGLLAHCEAGISRSTAAAITMLTAVGYRPQTAFGIVRRICPEMLPNRRMLRMADELMLTGGSLHHMAQNHRRKMFLRAGYEDPTLVRLREAQEEAASPWLRMRRRLVSAFPAGWRSLVGTGAWVRAMIAKDLATNRNGR